MNSMIQVWLSSQPCVLSGQTNFQLDVQGVGSNPAPGTSNWEEEWSLACNSANVQETE